MTWKKKRKKTHKAEHKWLIFDVISHLLCLSWQSFKLCCVFRCLGCTQRAVAVRIETIEVRIRCVAFYPEERKA